ncbi:hypothetical protein ACE6H2_023556 [Prunus campanulata]
MNYWVDLLEGGLILELRTAARRSFHISLLLQIPMDEGDGMGWDGMRWIFVVVDIY